MLALLQQYIFQAKIDEKSHVFWNLDFDRILGRVWEAKIIDFRTFFDVFSMSFFKRASEGEKIDQNEPTDTESIFFELGSGDPQAGGERKG